MKVLFCHDGPLRIDDNNNYYGIAHNDEMFQRYKVLGENLAVAIRLERIDNVQADNLSKLNIKPLKVFEVPNLSTLQGILYKRKIAYKIIKEAVLKSDFIVARLPSLIGFVAIDYAKKYNKPYLTEVVACPWDAYWNHSAKGKVIAPFVYLATKKRVKNSNYVVYVTNQFLQKRYPTNGRNVNCSNVYLTQFNNSILKNRIKKINNLNNKSKIIIGTTAAVNVKYKGQEYVIQALSELMKNGYNNFEYHLVGDGDKSYLKSVAKKFNVLDKVRFLGPLKHKEVFDWLDTIDLYVQPSRQEGLPRALIEAMSRGLPAFGAKTAGIPELLDDEFIFSNTNSNIREICEILISYTIEKMEKQAKVNFEKSKLYDKNVINKRREKFFLEFKKSVF